KVLPGIQEVLQEMQESMDSSSDVEYYGPEKSYSTYLKEILGKERETAGQSNLIQNDADSSQQSDGNPAEDSLSEEESVEEENYSVREEEGDQDSEEESDPESDNPCHDKHPETVTKTKTLSDQVVEAFNPDSPEDSVVIFLWVDCGERSVELQTTSEHRDIGSDGVSFPPDGSSPQLTSSPTTSPSQATSRPAPMH
ncbi:unnamed protein product, partial [Pleuronectes platessa]